MPWEKTEKYIRSGHNDPSKYDEFRTDVLSADEGIHAIYGRLKDTDKWEIQSYLFEVGKWSMDEAKTWFHGHVKMSCDISVPILLSEAEMENDVAGGECVLLHEGMFQGRFRFQAEDIIASTDLWNGLDVLSSHKHTDPMEICGSLEQPTSDKNGNLVVKFKTNKTTRGRDMAILLKDLKKRGKTISMSAGLNGTYIDLPDGTVLVKDIKPDHAAIIRFGHQAVDTANVKITFSAIDELPKEEKTMPEEKKELIELDKFKALETEFVELKKKNEALEARLKAYADAEIKAKKDVMLAKITEAGGEAKDEMTFEELENAYTIALEKKLKALAMVEKPVEIDKKPTERKYNALGGYAD